jgi:hypothetical protein
MIVNSFLSGFTSESRKSSSRLSQTGIDLELVNPGNHNGTIELEEERRGRSRSPHPKSQPEQLVFDEDDFRDHLDDPEGVADVFCSCSAHPGVTFCPLCNHPDVCMGEICICNMPVVDFARVKLNTKRQAVAYGDDGTQLSQDYCAVIVKLDEAREICLRAGLPEFLFEL